MKWIHGLPSYSQARQVARRPAPVRIARARGTIQRVDYRLRLLRVVAYGRVWEFVLSEDCQLWFDGTPAVLRCFHPLDPVSVLFQEQGAEYLVRAVYAWEPEPTAGN